MSGNSQMGGQGAGGYMPSAGMKNFMDNIQGQSAMSTAAGNPGALQLGTPGNGFIPYGGTPQLQSPGGGVGGGNPMYSPVAAMQDPTGAARRAANQAMHMQRANTPIPGGGGGGPTVAQAMASNSPFGSTDQEAQYWAQKWAAAGRDPSTLALNPNLSPAGAQSWQSALQQAYPGRTMGILNPTGGGNY